MKSLKSTIEEVLVACDDSYQDNPENNIDIRPLWNMVKPFIRKESRLKVVRLLADSLTPDWEWYL